MRAELDSLGAVWVCRSAAAMAAVKVGGVAAPPLEHRHPRIRIPRAGTQWIYLQSECTCQMKSVHAPCGGRQLSPGGRCLPLSGSGVTNNDEETRNQCSEEGCPSLTTMPAALWLACDACRRGGGLCGRAATAAGHHAAAVHSSAAISFRMRCSQGRDASKHVWCYGRHAGMRAVHPVTLCTTCLGGAFLTFSSAASSMRL